MTRREAFQALSAVFGVSMLNCSAGKDDQHLRFCLNTSTINGSKLGLMESLAVAVSAGFDSVEIWMRDVHAALNSGITARNIASRIAELGLTVENAIDFPRWLVDDETERRSALLQLRDVCSLLADLGCPRIALPPAGMTTIRVDPLIAAERFAAAAETAQSCGISPQLEIWGFSVNIGTLGEALYIAAQSGVANAGILADVYHLYKGGTPFESLDYVAAEALQIFHMNDYPAGIPKEQLQDSDRLLPGEGAAPWLLLGKLLRRKAPAVLSLELFNPSFWQLDPRKAAGIGLKKLKQALGLQT